MKRLVERHWFPSLPSTQTTLKNMIPDTRGKDLIVSTDNQTKGLTRSGNTDWVHLNKSITVSYGIRLRIASHMMSTLPMMQFVPSLSIHNTIRSLGISTQVQLKWPNDIYTNEKKCGGILVELVHTGGDEYCVVCGVGINVCDGPGGDYGNYGCVKVDQKEVLVDGIYDNIIQYVRLFEGANREGEVVYNRIRKDMNDRLMWINTQVEVIDKEGGGEIARGVLTGVNKFAGVDITRSDGSVFVVDRLHSLRQSAINKQK